MHRPSVRSSFWVLIGLAAVTFAAQADEIIPLYDGAGMSQWDAARDADRLAEEFAHYRLEPQGGDAPHLRWEFATREISYSDVHLFRSIERPFQAIRVTLANDGPAFDLCLKVLEQNGAQWAPPPQRVEAGQDWTTFSFPVEELAVASWSRDTNNELDLPAVAFALIAFDLTPQTDYAVRISAVELIPYPAPEFAVEALTLPRQVDAGDTFDFSIQMRRLSEADLPPGAVELRFVQHDQVRLSMPLAEEMIADTANGTRTLQARLNVPLYAWTGRHDVRLAIGGVDARFNGAPNLGEMIVTGPERTPTAARVEDYRGAPTLFINGEPHDGMAQACYHPAVETYREFAEAGVSLYSFAATPSESAYGLSKTCWVAPDQFDYSEFDARAMMLLEADPDAYFFPRLYVHAPEWWTEQNPDELVYFDPGNGQPELFLLNGRTKTPSWASEKWRIDTAETLRRFIDHVEASPFAGRCIGYQIASGTTEEWMMWGSNEDQWVDYGPANTARFRAWLRERYETDAALQAAWSDPDVTFDTAAVPTRAERSATERGIFRDPNAAQPCIDYYAYTSWLTADAILYLARAVKEHAGPDRVVGTFYGYTLQLFGQRQQNAGHLALRQLWESPYIDFVCSPSSYAFRDVGGRGTSHIMSLLGGLQLHGKLWFSETDIRTSLTEVASGMWGRPDTVEEDCLQQDKELGRILTQGIAHWWFDVGRIRYDHPMLMDRIAGWCAAAERARDASREPVDEIAVLIDPRSFTFLQVGDPISPQLILEQLPQLARIGAPTAYYTLDDLDRLAPHRMYVFLGCAAPTAAQRAHIDRLKANGALLLFVYANGVYRDGQWAPEAMAELMGLDVRLEEAAGPLLVQVGDALGEDAAGLAYGPAQTPGPVVWCADAAATTLGTLSDGRAGLAIRRHDDWTVAFSAGPMLPAQVLRAFAREAGVHLYIDSYDVVWARRGMLTVCVEQGGTRTIRLPEPAAVTDVYTDAVIAENAEAFSAELAPLSTTAWRLDPTP